MSIGKILIGALRSLTRTVYVDGAGYYYLPSDEQRASVATHRLMRQLKIAPPLEYERI
jgi:hypothetical protein